MHIPLWSQPPHRADLGREELHLWLIPLDVDDADADWGAQILSAEEVSRAQRIYFERNARRFVAAHAALRSILAGYAATDPQALRFEITAHGKPLLVPSATHAIADLAFNLSHSAALALIAVARGRRVGVDIEQIRPELADSKFADRFFSAAEVRDLRALPVAEQGRAFFRCWTRKEAFVKARGDGLSLPLHSFDVTLRPDQPAALLHTRPDPDEADRWSLHAVLVDAAPGYEAAVAVEGMVADLRYMRFLREG
jgi:4'-phosphopantetheinyl transferase